MILKGNAVSKGIAVGKLLVYEPLDIRVSESFCEDGAKAELLAHFAATKIEAERELHEIFTKLEKDDPQKAKIFAAHRDILNDEAIEEEILNGINEENWRPDWAIEKVYSKFIRMLNRAPDPLIRERSTDLLDVKGRLLRLWHGAKNCGLSSLTEPVIIATHDLLPSDTASLDRKMVLAILTEIGGATSHSAIIARSYEIPAILGVSELLSKVTSGQTVAVDAINGEITLAPSVEIIEQTLDSRCVFLEKLAETKQFLDKSPLTADGVHIDIGLNIGSASDEELEFQRHTDFVGLFRTEFLYMGRSELPSEDEQFKIYKNVLEAYGERPVTLRTLDIGGDKTLSCIDLPREENPFLGKRALRLCFSMPQMFKTQLRAALRASVFGNLWLMLPMVGSLDDIYRAKEIIRQVKSDLDAEGIPYKPDFKLGIMVEIPSIAVIADLAAQEVDFASIGTNDLSQYLMAADRMNPELSDYCQSFHPAMFRIMGNVIREFNRAGKPISVCGEMGGDPLAAPVLVGLGLKKLSMGAASIAGIKRVLSGITISSAEALAKKVVDLPNAKRVEDFLKQELNFIK